MDSVSEEAALAPELEKEYRGCQAFETCLAEALWRWSCAFSSVDITEKCPIFYFDEPS
jgi:hypothetical protein